MKLISHRGNLNGRDEKSENSPQAVDNAIQRGHDVEVDVWYVNNSWSLGHDAPTHSIDFQWLLNRSSNLWVHCKNVEAVERIQFLGSPVHYFWHEEDTITLTSRGIIWAYPGKQPIIGSVAVMPEIHNDDVRGCIGVCSDFVESYQSKPAATVQVQTECSGLIQLYRKLFSKDPELVLDFGACDLRDSLTVAQHCPNTKILAFEPHPNYYQVCLQRNVHPDRIEVINSAISDTDGTVKFHIPLGNQGASSMLAPNMVPHTTDGRVVTTEVKAIRLDGFFKSRGIDVIDMVWMDVQGAELTCLKGMGEYLKSVKVIQTEVGIKAYYQGHTLYPDIKAYLIDNGFIELGISPDWEYESNAIFLNTRFSDGKAIQ